jgi:hypothetical protein
VTCRFSPASNKIGRKLAEPAKRFCLITGNDPDKGGGDRTAGLRPGPTRSDRGGLQREPSSELWHIGSCWSLPAHSWKTLRGLSLPPSWGRRFCQCGDLDFVKLFHRLQRHETNPCADEAIFASHEKGRKPMPGTNPTHVIKTNGVRSC